VVELRTKQNKNGKRMAFATLDDRTGRLEVAVFSEVFEKYRDYLSKDALLVAEGTLAMDDFSGQLRLSAERLFSIEQARAHFAKHLLIQWSAVNGVDSSDGKDFAAELQDLLQPFQGGVCPVCIEYRGPTSQSMIQLGESWRIHPGDTLLTRLQKRIGADRVRMLYP
jgi:DNA polymerase-3 subunit alpha